MQSLLRQLRQYKELVFRTAGLADLSLITQPISHTAPPFRCLYLLTTWCYCFYFYLALSTGCCCADG
jgi:hypothetical protein